MQASFLITRPPVRRGAAHMLALRTEDGAVRGPICRSSGSRLTRVPKLCPCGGLSAFPLKKIIVFRDSVFSAKLKPPVLTDSGHSCFPPDTWLGETALCTPYVSTFWPVCPRNLRTWLNQSSCSAMLFLQPGPWTLSILCLETYLTRYTFKNCLILSFSLGKSKFFLCKVGFKYFKWKQEMSQTMKQLSSPSFYCLQDVRCWLDCNFLLINTWEVDVCGPSELVRPTRVSVTSGKPLCSCQGDEISASWVTYTYVLRLTVIEVPK